jgi:hypothetical protein
MYRVWLADANETDGEDYDCRSRYKAAECFAMDRHTEDGHDDWFLVMVREDDGEAFRIAVEIKHIPQFTAYLVKND